MNTVHGIFGIAVLLGLCLALSRDRRRIRWRIVASGLVLQIVLGLIVFRTALGAQALRQVSDALLSLLQFSYEGSRFVFGELGARDSSAGLVLAFQILPLVIYFAALMAILYHLRILQLVVYALAQLLGRLLGVSGAEAMAMTANMFVGMTEAPLVIRPYLERLTTSELMALMTGGFATIAGTVFGVYLAFVGDAYGPFLLAASVMSAPAAFVTAKIIVPEGEAPQTGERLELDLSSPHDNLLAAIATGTADGLKLALNIGAMLIAFYALIALINWPLDTWFGTSIQDVFGFVLRPLAWCLGVSWDDAGRVGTLLGIKVTTNELLAFRALQGLIEDGSLSPRSIKIATFALCGFANFGSVGVTLGGLGQLMPSRREELSRLALPAMVAGALASFLTAAVAGTLL